MHTAITGEDCSLRNEYHRGTKQGHDLLLLFIIKSGAASHIGPWSVYPHTLPNRSSVLFTLPPPVLAGPGDVATGLACDHPPNSSSCWTENPPALVDVFAGFAGSGSPQPESNALVVSAGAGVDLKAGVDTGAGAGLALAGSGSGVAHASFESQTFEPVNVGTAEV